MSDEESDEFFVSADEGSDDNLPYWSAAQKVLKNLRTSGESPIPGNDSKLDEPPADHEPSSNSILGVTVSEDSTSKFRELRKSAQELEESKSLETSSGTSDKGNILDFTSDPTHLVSELKISAGAGDSSSSKPELLKSKSKATNHTHVGSRETSDDHSRENGCNKPQIELDKLPNSIDLTRSDVFTSESVEFPRDCEVEPGASSIIMKPEKLEVDFSSDILTESTAKVDETAWNLNGVFWANNSEAELLSSKKSIGDKSGWDVEDGPWTSSHCVSSEKENTQETSPKTDNCANEVLCNVEDKVLKSAQSKRLKMTSHSAQNQPIIVEDEGGWDLENDPWASAETKLNEGWAVEDWDGGDELPTEPSAAPYPSKELASAATALVKTVGGGIANFVEGFKLSNLSSTLAAFEEKSATGVPLQPTPSTSVCQKGGGSGLGWGSWDLGSLAKTLTSTVESTGMQIINGSVDVLEHIGKKTFTALKENDPGLVYTKSILRPVEATPVPQLSQILREASERYAAPGSIHSATSEWTATAGATRVEALRGDLASQLESRLALVHMEALKLLGSRSSARLAARLAHLESEGAEHTTHVQSLAAQGGVLERISQTLQLKELEGRGERESALASMADALSSLHKVTPASALLKTFEDAQRRSEETHPNEIPMQEIFFRAIEALAETTAAVLAYLHKLAECLILLGRHRDSLDTGFLDIAGQVFSLVSSAKLQNESLCSTYVEHLKQAAAEVRKRRSGDPSSAGQEAGDALTTSRRMVASLFLETGTANGYLDDATTGHFVPVLQMACLDSFFPDDSASTTPFSAAFKTSKS